MPINVSSKSFGYDDLNFRPYHSKIHSRLDTDVTTVLGRGLDGIIPIIASPMASVSGEDMLVAMHEAGGLGILHRYQPIEERKRILNTILLKTQNKARVGVAIGLDDSLSEITSLTQYANLLCIDVAYADNEKVLNFIEQVKNIIPTSFPLMAGNVCTFQGSINLIKAGTNIIRSGIGGGACCSTRRVNGCGIGNLTAFNECRDAIISAGKSGSVFLVGDGGVRWPADLCKGLAVGCDAMMIGSLFAGTTESPGGVVNGYKEHFGMASKRAQNAWKGFKEGTAAEGVSVKVLFKGSVKPVIEELLGGLRSCMTYTGSRNIKELWESEFTEMAPGAIVEGSPHILNQPGVVHD